MTFHFDNQFLQQFTNLSSEQSPMGFAEAELVVRNRALQQYLGLAYSRQQMTAIASGQALASGMQPLAQKYAGHQFGHYNPYLGDGRGLLLGEWQTRNGRYDLHLKGSGPTPYSRGGDGRAVLRSCIREFLAGEALAALNVPTTRALAVTRGNITVYREQPEPSAMLLRVARTHIRFGHFQHCYQRGMEHELKQLIDYVIQTQWPDLLDQPRSEFFSRVVACTAEMIALWQVYGFNHGVMNSDNMSILGETLDFGPYAFLDRYEPELVCNHSDTTGRYRFSEQPSIGLWNLHVLAQALSPIISSDALVAALERYTEHLQNTYWCHMTARLGLPNNIKNRQLVSQWLAILAASGQDYSLSFTQLQRSSIEHQQGILPSKLTAQVDFADWWRRYQSMADERDFTLMAARNPYYILRNYLVQQTIEAAEQHDYKPLQRLYRVLQRPFELQPDTADLLQEPPNWGRELKISCSS